MNWRNIVCSVLLLSGCAGAGGESSFPESGDEPAALKISYFRTYSFQNPRTKKAEFRPSYHVVFSETWQNRIGQVAREPFVKATRDAAGKRTLYIGYLPDAKIQQFLRKFQSLGIDQLRPSEPESYKPDELNRKSLDPKEWEYTRILTIGNDKEHKSYYYRDQQVSAELIKIFVKCEAYAEAVMRNTLQVQTETAPLFPGNK